MSNRSYSAGQGDREPAGPERELLKLLGHEAPEVRGLTAMLVGKFAMKGPVNAAVAESVRQMAAEDAHARVRVSAQCGADGIARGDAKRAAEPTLIVPHGGYEGLASYQMAEIAFDGTNYFCDRYVSIRSRTHDQMVQSARSGKQNIAEGSQVSGTSKKTELKLVGVARGSLEELKKDYHDFLRTRGLELWDKHDPRAKAVRQLCYAENRSYKTYKPYIEGDSAEIAANALLCVVHQACYLLDRQLAALDAAFLEHGGFTERLYELRRERRGRRCGRE